MKKFDLDKIQEVFSEISRKVDSNVYLTAVKNGMLGYMPFTIVASVFMIIAYFPIPQVTDFITSLLRVSDASVWQSKLMYVNDATLSVGGIYVLITLTKSLAESFKTNVNQCMLVAVSSFLLLTPQNIFEGEKFIEISRIGVQSMFLAIIVGIVSTLIYKKIDEKGIKIKLPSSVPPVVAGPFESILPMFFVTTFFWIVRILFELVLNSDVLTVVNQLLSAPLTKIGASLAGLIFLRILENLFWFFGLHGGSIMDSVVGPIYQLLEDQNRAATIAGLDPVNIITQGFRANFMIIGWIGASIALVLVAKSRQYKEIGKLSLVPHLFNIGEPTLFGIPLLLNFSYIIPFLFSNVVSIVIAYSAFATGLVPKITGTAQLPWTTPPIISGYLVTGSVRGSILQLVLIVIVTLIWLPFVKMQDKKLYKEEQEEALKIKAQEQDNPEESTQLSGD